MTPPPTSVVRLTALDHRLGRRVVVAEWRRCLSPRHARDMAAPALATLHHLRLELPLLHRKAPDGEWQPLPILEPPQRRG